MIRLSIIIPFYNVEKYIEQCIRSLYNQDIPQEEYEVICVDDCGSDGSRAIVERLQKEYTNLRLVINAENRKLGGARNAGLDVAEGEYIWFVDSDDYIAANCLKSFLEELDKNHLDLIQFENYTVYNDIVDTSNPQEYEDSRIVSGTEFVLSQPQGNWSCRCPIAWNRIIRRSFWNAHNLRFVEHMMYEDTELSLYMYPLVQRMKHLNQVGYYYRINPQSITHAKASGLTMWYKVMQLNRCLPAYHHAPDEVYRKLVVNYLQRELGQFRNLIKSMDMQERTNYMRRMMHENISGLRMFCNWRTWFAIKFGICWFVPNSRKIL